MTALYTVLVAADDLQEPIADETRGILDGHIVLSRALGERNQWPAIDVLASLSRVMDVVVDEPHRRAAGRVRELLASYEQKRDLILLGAYQPGSRSAHRRGHREARGHRGLSAAGAGRDLVGRPRRASGCWLCARRSPP